MRAVPTFLLGMLYGAGLYVVADYLLFGRYSIVDAAEQILREASDAD